jgi:hypothetical protein
VFSVNLCHLLRPHEATDHIDPVRLPKTKEGVRHKMGSALDLYVLSYFKLEKLRKE